MKTLFLTLFLTVMSLSATQISTVTLEEHNGRVYSGFYVGPAYLNLFENYAWCFDNTRDVRLGDTWEAKILTFEELEQAYFTQFPDFVERYKRIAFLGTLFNVYPEKEWGNIQFAIWNVFNDLNTKNNPKIDYYLNLPNTLDNYDMFRVVVDVNGRLQGFMTTIPKSGEVPEPMTMGMIGFGLCGIAFFRRNK